MYGLETVRLRATQHRDGGNKTWRTSFDKGRGGLSGIIKARLMVIGMLGFQTTVSRPVTLSGIGVHSGADVSITFNPAEADTGVVYSNRMHDNGEVTEPALFPPRLATPTCAPFSAFLRAPSRRSNM